MNMQEKIEGLAVASTVCPRCEAKPGAMCTTISGGRADYPHETRTLPLRAAASVAVPMATIEGETAEIDGMELVETTLVEKMVASGIEAIAGRE